MSSLVIVAADLNKSISDPSEIQAVLDEDKEEQVVQPRMRSVERAMKLPVVEAALHHTQDMYGKVKGSNALVSWAFESTENTVQRAMTTVSPLVNRMERPLKVVDEALMKTLDKLEISVPIVKEPAHEIYNKAMATLNGHKGTLSSTVQGSVDAVLGMAGNGTRSLKETSWNKTNQVLSTQYGNMAVQGISSSSAFAERVLDHYLPSGKEEAASTSFIVPIETDPALHSVQTVANLGTKVARRVYRGVSDQVGALNMDTVRDLIAVPISAMRRSKSTPTLSDDDRDQNSSLEYQDAVATSVM